jgi:hypothetical protein
MHELLQQIFSGLAAGTIYASLALALVMIYRATELVNFAHGEMAMFSTYIAWSGGAAPSTPARHTQQRDERHAVDGAARAGLRYVSPCGHRSR